jgi:lantibiotic modifying enzyme
LNQSIETLDFEDNSVYTGLSGIALTYLKLYEVTEGNKEYLERADSLIKASLDNLSRDKISFLCGDAGPLAIVAYISHLKGDFNGCKKYVERCYTVIKSSL